METKIVDESFLKQVEALDLPKKQENNPWIVLHVFGDGKRASPKFNVKIYRNKKGIFKLVTNDFHTLQQLLEGKNTRKKFERVIMADDSGWGYPCSGVLVGVHDSETNMLMFREIDVKYFQDPLFSEKAYLQEYARQGIAIIDELNPDKNSTLIQICTGYVNTALKDQLREKGYHVEVAEIGEPLQTALEEEHKKYIMKLGLDYYDPKEVPPEKIPSMFQHVLEQMKKKNLTHLAKSGWQFFKK